MKNNKKVQLRLDEETNELLNSLSLRFNCSKSECIRKALKIMAKSKKHYITIGYFEPNQTTSETNEIESDETMEELFKQIDALKG